MSRAADPVDVLLELEPGESVHVETEGYRWQSPLTVADVDRHTFHDPEGNPWDAVELALEPEHPLGTTKRLVAFDGLEAARIDEYGTVVSVDHNGHRDQAADDHPGRLARSAVEIVETAHGTGGHPTDLERVLEVVEGETSVLDVHQRLPFASIKRTKQVLWELDLCTTGKTALRPSDELEPWIEELREEYL